MDGHAISPLQQNADIKNLLKQWTRRIDSLASLGEASKVKVDETQAKFKATVTEYTPDNGQLCGSDDAGLKRISECVESLKKCKEAKDACELNILNQHKALLFELLDTYGRSNSEKWFSEWQGQSVTQLSLHTARPETTAHGAENQQVCDTTGLRFGPIHDGLLLPPDSHAPPAENRNDHPDHFVIGRTVEKNTNSNGHQSGEAQQVPVIPQKKRGLSFPTPGIPKRYRAEEPQHPVTQSNVIDFDELYKQRKDEKSHTIIAYDGKWYILECSEHTPPVCFATKDPIRGASRHQSSVHDLSPADYKTTIIRNGIQVSNCSTELAYLYNEAPAHGNINPKPGDVYMTRWDKKKLFYAILVLPWRMHGQRSRLIVEEINLFSNIPKCYKYDLNNQTVQWAPEYKSEGPYNLARQYPVMFFDEQYSLTDCHVAWLPLYDFQEYDSSHTDIYNKNVVDAFIRSTGKVSTTEGEFVGYANCASCRSKE
ncbi:uncharacterized protein QYS62_011614 [Fusarium acuminatum]|uniref:Uncharacterized protein n=1 Tax=Fusarium acuminatum TaxID=5515 RepID=A0ABZ2XD60_9HYPO